jgi:RHS repeat-associated protein
MNQDTAANEYDFPAREYEYAGRWPSPDPAGMAAVDPTNPQSWNRYAYVGNGPLSYIDPTGLSKTPAPPTLFVGLYQDCIWNGDCSGLMQGPPYAGFNIGVLGGLAPGSYIDGVQQTVFNSIGGLGANALATGYQCTVNNSDGSTTIYNLTTSSLNGEIYSSDVIAFQTIVYWLSYTPPGYTPFSPVVPLNFSFSWTGGSCNGSATCPGQISSKASFSTTKPGAGNVNPIIPPKKVSSTPTAGIFQLYFPNVPDSVDLLNWSLPPYIW